MEGRLENELQITNTIEKKLKFMPEYVKRWHKYLYASDDTAASRYDMINKVYRFLVFVSNKKDIRDVELNLITEDSVDDYLIYIKTKKDMNKDISSTSDSYQQSVYCALKNFFDFLYERGYIEKNFLLQIKKPKNKDLDRINANRTRLTEKDFKLIMHAAGIERDPILRKRDSAILSIFMTTGMRKTALKSINISDIDFENKTLLVYDKNDMPKFYVLPDETINYISDWLLVRKEYVGNIQTDALFLSYKGNRMCDNSISKVVVKYSSKGIGKICRPHKLRSGYCSILYNKTKDIEFVRRAVKHANSQTTQRYVVMENDAQKQAAKIMSECL